MYEFKQFLINMDYLQEFIDAKEPPWYSKYIGTEIELRELFDTMIQFSGDSDRYIDDEWRYICSYHNKTIMCLPYEEMKVSLLNTSKSQMILKGLRDV